MELCDASVAESSSSPSPGTKGHWVDDLVVQLVGDSNNMKKAIKELLAKLDIDTPKMLSDIALRPELAKALADEVDTLGCSIFCKRYIKELLPELLKKAERLHSSTVTPLHMQEMAARSRKAWSDLTAKLGDWVATHAKSGDVTARYTREALSAREPSLGNDSTTLYFQCLECSTKLAVKGSHSFYNIQAHLWGTHPDEFSAPSRSSKRKKTSDSSESREGACH